jgi:biopolymer transport protein ExbD
MLIHPVPADRRRADQQIQRTLTVTQLGVWIVVLLVVWCFTPLRAPGVWPLLDEASSTTGEKSPGREDDVWLSITSDGNLYADERPVTMGQLTGILSQASQRGTDRRGDYERDVFVRIDRAAAFRSVRQVLLAAQAAGRLRLTFLTARGVPDPSEGSGGNRWRSTPPGHVGGDAGAAARELTPDRNLPPYPESASPWWTAGCGDIVPLQVGGSVVPPRLLRRVDPVLADGSRRSSGAILVIETVIGSSGGVCAARLVKGAPGAYGDRLAEASLEAVRQWRFRPASLNGRPMAAVYNVTVRFEVR